MKQTVPASEIIPKSERTLQRSLSAGKPLGHVIEEMAQAQDELILALSEMMTLITSGKHCEGANPYSRPEINRGLAAMAKARGIEATYDTNDNYRRQVGIDASMSGLGILDDLRKQKTRVMAKQQEDLSGGKIKARFVTIYESSRAESECLLDSNTGVISDIQHDDCFDAVVREQVEVIVNGEIFTLDCELCSDDSYLIGDAEMERLRNALGSPSLSGPR